MSYYKFDAGSYTDILDLAAWNALPEAARREFNAKYSAGIKNIFEILANEENYPVYIHCDNGADETGTVAFLIIFNPPSSTLFRYTPYFRFRHSRFDNGRGREIQKRA